jgi:hypothetical protein
MLEALQPQHEFEHHGPVARGVGVPNAKLRHGYAPVSARRNPSARRTFWTIACFEAAMTAPFRKWTVLPHGKLTAVAENIRTVTGTARMPFGEFPRRMTVVRLTDGRLVVYSAVALDADGMRSLEAFGEPAFLIVPGDHHRLDAGIWKDRYPRLRVVAPPGARAKIEETVAVDATEIDFGDPGVCFATVLGTRGHEAALEVHGADGFTLVLNDIVANIRHAPGGFTGWLWRVMGFAGDAPQIPLPEKLTILDDKAALAAQLRNWANDPALKRILVSHGDPIETDPAGALRALAAALD